MSAGKEKFALMGFIEMLNRWPQAGDVCSGYVSYVVPAMVPANHVPTPVWLGLVRCYPSDWAAVPADWPENPLRFEFWSLTGLDQGETVVFDITAGAYANYATNVQAVDTVQDLAAIVARLAEKEGNHAGAEELRQLSDHLYE